MFASNTPFISAVSISSFFSAQSQVSPQPHFSSHMPFMQAQPSTPLPSIMQGQVSSMVWVLSISDGSAQQAEAAVRVVSIHSARNSAIQVFFIENTLRFIFGLLVPRRFRRLGSWVGSPRLRGSARSGS